ncbi:MAG: multicomponent Na+:H+ antiporter subunit F [Glaciecola sp.]|jgi:multicomponent Na+:H+ antiporter subunit F
MKEYYLVAALAILIAMALGVFRALVGPTVFDRILAVNMFGTKAVLLVAIFAFFTGRHDLLDICLLYSLLNFVGVIAALRLVEQGKFFANNSGKSQSKTTDDEVKGSTESSLQKEDHDA